MSHEEQRDAFTKAYFERKQARVELAAVESEIQRIGKRLTYLGDLLLRLPEMPAFEREFLNLPTSERILALLNRRQELQTEEKRLDSLVERMEAEG